MVVNCLDSGICDKLLCRFLFILFLILLACLIRLFNDLYLVSYFIVVLGLYLGMFGILLILFFINVRKLIICFGGMLNFFIIFLWFIMLLFMVLISVICLLISCVIFLLLVEIIVLMFCWVVCLYRVLMILFVLMSLMISSGKFILWIVLCNGFIWLCKLLGIGGWFVLYFVYILLWKVLFFVLNIIVMCLGL